ncbi:sodium/potassium/calcium exchanger 3-like [Haliotis rufescens]|uniref:sodium/potassium/calcium exchanger 3-like n=1 Tax=Haliotis rufescens TaxID=6454 RepID=UPI00201EF2B0|nr:sodium/potassium/calcium exchanger 3-like [Haliotis rufescens]
MEGGTRFAERSRLTRRTRQRSRLVKLVLVACVYLLGVAVTVGVRVIRGEKEDVITQEDEYSEYRVRRAADLEEEERNCTPRSVDNFFGNFFTLEQTQDGGFVLHLFIAIYLFASLAIICDDYFVASLELICENLGLQEDVAGATFMAAGSSAPELFTSVIGVFFAKSDVGVGTIVGSAVFNLLFIIGVCGLLAGMVIHLTWWPVIRDTGFYLLSVLALVIVINDTEVYWYEGMAMLIMYALYIIIMYFNRPLETRAEVHFEKFRQWWRKKYPKTDVKQPLIGGKAAPQKKAENNGEAETAFNDDPMCQSLEDQHHEKEYESPWTVPNGVVHRIYWFAMVPIRCLLHFTVPDCRRPGKWRKTYPLTFTLSIVWIAAFSYVMVWMVTIAGDALNIPDTVMGLTILAAGTSVPDCLSSVFVARDGWGDMAVSNSIGSNVFDILICLGLPWLLQTAAVTPGESLSISSSGLVYSSLTLLGTVVFLIVSLTINGWRLNKPLGVVYLVVYVIVMALTCLYELNVFGDLNPPSCPRPE